MQRAQESVNRMSVPELRLPPNRVAKSTCSECRGCREYAVEWEKETDTFLRVSESQIRFEWERGKNAL